MTTFSFAVCFSLSLCIPIMVEGVITKVKVKGTLNWTKGSCLDRFSQFNEL